MLTNWKKLTKYHQTPTKNLFNNSSQNIKIYQDIYQIANEW